jgi:WD40 repeat protein
VRPIASPLIYRGHEHANHIQTIAWSPTGNLIASSSGTTGTIPIGYSSLGTQRERPDHTIHLWDTTTGRRLLSCVGHENTVMSLDFSPDGSCLVSGSYDGTVRIWNINQRTKLLRRRASVLCYTKHRDDLVDGACWSPDGTRICSRATTGSSALHIWDSRSGRRISTRRSLSNGRGQPTVVWCPNGSRVAHLYLSHVEVVYPASGEIDHKFWGASGALCLAWSPVGSAIASAGEDLHIYDVTSRAHMITIPSGYDGKPVFETVAWSPNGRHLAVAGRHRKVQIWDTRRTDWIKHYEAHNDWVTTLAWSPDGTRIASGGADRVVRVWRVHEGN